MQHGFALWIGVIVLAFLIAAAVAAWIVFGAARESQPVLSLAELPAAAGDWSATAETA